MTVASIRTEGAKRLSRWCIYPLLAALVFISGCTRSVTWEEEVPLNTGETIWVKRSGTYSFGSESGNPLKFGYNPDWRSTMEFTYKGKKYKHTDVVTLILLAIGPDGMPNLIADPRRDEWQWKHKYYCVAPYYVQFRPDSTGSQWNWPDHIDSWIYGLPTNLTFGLAPMGSSGKKYSSADRVAKNASVTVMHNEFNRIDPSYTTDNCPHKD